MLREGRPWAPGGCRAAPLGRRVVETAPIGATSMSRRKDGAASRKGAVGRERMVVASRSSRAPHDPLACEPQRLVVGRTDQHLVALLARLPGVLAGERDDQRAGGLDRGVAVLVLAHDR